MQRPLKILHFTSSFDLGGKEARTVQLINHFGKRARHVIVNHDMDASSASQRIAANIAWRFADDPPRLNGRFSVKRLAELAAYMQPFDLVLTYNWGAMDAVMARTVFAQQMQLPQLIHHEDGFNSDEANGLKIARNWWRRVALYGAWQLIVPSKTLYHIALKSWGQKPESVEYIGNGIDVASYRQVPNPKNLPGFTAQADELVIGTLAGLRPVKNLTRLVRVAAGVQQQTGQKIRLVIVGTGPDRTNIIAEAKRCDFAEQLLMPGYLDQPAKFIGLFDIFALSSDSEQCPLSVIEAMAAGLPVAAPNIGDIADMLAEDNRKLLGVAGDEAALQSLLAKLCCDPDLRQKLGEANRLKAIRQFDQSDMISHYARLYGSAAGNRGALSA